MYQDEPDLLANSKMSMFSDHAQGASDVSSRELWSGIVSLV